MADQKKNILKNFQVGKVGDDFLDTDSEISEKEYDIDLENDKEIECEKYNSDSEFTEEEEEKEEKMNEKEQKKMKMERFIQKNTFEFVKECKNKIAEFIVSEDNPEIYNYDENENLYMYKEQQEIINKFYSEKVLKDDYMNLIKEEDIKNIANKNLKKAYFEEEKNDNYYYFSANKNGRYQLYKILKSEIYRTFTLSKICENNIQINEYIRGKRRIFIDIEFKMMFLEIMNEDTFSKIQILKKYQWIYRTKLENIFRNFYVFQSQINDSNLKENFNEPNFKFSYHLIHKKGYTSNGFLSKIFVKNEIEKVKSIDTIFVQFLESVNAFDFSVYSEKQQFRTLFSKKASKLDQSLYVDNYFEDKGKRIRINRFLRKYMIQDVEKCENMDPISLYDINKEEEYRKNISDFVNKTMISDFSNENIQNKTEDSIEKLVNQYKIQCKNADKKMSSDSKIWRNFTLVASKLCSILRRKNESELERNVVLSWIEYSKKSDNKFDLQNNCRILDELVKKQDANKNLKVFSEEINRLNFCKKIDYISRFNYDQISNNAQFIHEDYLLNLNTNQLNFETEQNNYIIQSKCGSGKQKCIEKLIEMQYEKFNRKSKFNVLCLSTRISLSYQQKKLFKDNKFNVFHYKQKYDEISDEISENVNKNANINVHIVSFESLYKYAKNSFDMIIIDEFQTFLYSLQSVLNIKNKVENAVLIFKYINKCESYVFLDGFFMIKQLKIFMADLDDKNVELIINEKKDVKKIEIVKVEDIIGIIKLQRINKCPIATISRKKAFRLQDIGNDMGRNFQVFTKNEKNRSSFDQKQLFLKDFEEFKKKTKMDNFIFNLTFSCGIDIQENIEKLILFVKYDFIQYHQLYQLVNRIRKFKHLIICPYSDFNCKKVNELKIEKLSFSENFTQRNDNYKLLELFDNDSTFIVNGKKVSIHHAQEYMKEQNTLEKFDMQFQEKNYIEMFEKDEEIKINNSTELTRTEYFLHHLKIKYDNNLAKKFKYDINKGFREEVINNLLESDVNLNFVDKIERISDKNNIQYNKDIAELEILNTNNQLIVLKKILNKELNAQDIKSQINNENILKFLGITSDSWIIRKIKKMIENTDYIMEEHKTKKDRSYILKKSNA